MGSAAAGTGVQKHSGRVEPPGRAVGGVEGPTPRGDGSVINSTTAGVSVVSPIQHLQQQHLLEQQQLLQQQQQQQRQLLQQGADPQTVYIKGVAYAPVAQQQQQHHQHQFLEQAWASHWRGSWLPWQHPSYASAPVHAYQDPSWSQGGCCGGGDVELSKFDYRRYLPASERKKQLFINTPEDLWHFQNCLLGELIYDGEDVRGFSDHMTYVSEMARTCMYDVKALVAYDEGMLERARRGGVGVFHGADTNLTNTKLGVSGTKAAMAAHSSLKQRGASTYRSTGDLVVTRKNRERF